MKTPFKLAGVVFMVLATIQLFGQAETFSLNPKSSGQLTDPGNKQPAEVSSGMGSYSFHNDLSGIESQIYIGKNWPLGRIVLRNGNIIDNYNLRYNMLSDQMQFIFGKDTLAFASPSEIHSVTFDNRVFVYETFQCDNIVRQGYFELLEPGKNRLLLKRGVIYQLNNKNGEEGHGNETYLIDQCYFISRSGMPAYKLMCSKRSVLSAMGEHKREIEAYMKATGNKVRNENDLRKLVAYFNSLDDK